MWEFVESQRRIKSRYLHKEGRKIILLSKDSRFRGTNNTCFISLIDPLNIQVHISRNTYNCVYVWFRS